MNACRSVWGRDDLADPGAAGGLADDPPGTVPVQPPPVRGQEHRAAGALADGQVDRPGRARRERYGDDLAALAGDGQSPVPALQTQMLDIGTSGLRHSNPFSASREISACSVGGPSPAATSRAPSSLRSRATARDS